jgi:hypothetical protein
MEVSNYGKVGRPENIEEQPPNCNRSGTMDDPKIIQPAEDEGEALGAPLSN